MSAPLTRGQIAFELPQLSYIDTRWEEPVLPAEAQPTREHGAGGWFERRIEAFRTWRENARALAELRRMSNVELRDVGLNRGDFDRNRKLGRCALLARSAAADQIGPPAPEPDRACRPAAHRRHLRQHPQHPHQCAHALALQSAGKRVIIAGLDQDYTGKPFEPMPQLLSIAEFITKTHAICVRCGATANYSQRTVESEALVEVGASDKYEARCRKCFVPHADAPTPE